jgi:hypothetical protein
MPFFAEIDADVLPELAVRAALENWAGDVELTGAGRPPSELEVVERARRVELDELMLERGPP